MLTCIYLPGFETACEGGCVDALFQGMDGVVVRFAVNHVKKVPAGRMLPDGFFACVTWTCWQVRCSHCT